MMFLLSFHIGNDVTPPIFLLLTCDISRGNLSFLMRHQIPKTHPNLSAARSSNSSAFSSASASDMG